MHFIDKDSKVRATAKAMVSAEAGEDAFRHAARECAARVSELFKEEHGAAPHASWLEVTQGPGVKEYNLREVRVSVTLPASGRVVVVDGGVRPLPFCADERTQIPVAQLQHFSWVGESMPPVRETAATFDGWDADTGLMVFTAK